MHWDSLKLLFFVSALAWPRAAWGRFGPSGVVGGVGPVKAEWGWGGVGHALGFHYLTLRLGPGRFRPSGAE